MGCHNFTITLKCLIAFIHLSQKIYTGPCSTKMNNQCYILFMNSELLCTLHIQYYNSRVLLIYSKSEFSQFPPSLVMFCIKHSGKMNKWFHILKWIHNSCLLYYKYIIRCHYPTINFIVIFCPSHILVTRRKVYAVTHSIDMIISHTLQGFCKACVLHWPWYT